MNKNKIATCNNFNDYDYIIRISVNCNNWEPGPTTREPGPANQNEFFSTEGPYYRQKYSSVSLVVQVAGPRWSHRWRSQMWRFWAGVVTRVCCCEASWIYCQILENNMFEKFNFLATALVDIPAVSMSITRSLNVRHLWHCVLTKLHILVVCPQHKVHLCNDHAV